VDISIVFIEFSRGYFFIVSTRGTRFIDDSCFHRLLGGKRKSRRVMKLKIVLERILVYVSIIIGFLGLFVPLYQQDILSRLLFLTFLAAGTIQLPFKNDRLKHFIFFLLLVTGIIVASFLGGEPFIS
jgi:hypothetical protein